MRAGRCRGRRVAARRPPACWRPPGPRRAGHAVRVPRRAQGRRAGALWTPRRGGGGDRGRGGRDWAAARGVDRHAVAGAGRSLRRADARRGTGTTSSPTRWPGARRRRWCRGGRRAWRRTRRCSWCRRCWRGCGRSGRAARARFGGRVVAVTGLGRQDRQPRRCCATALGGAGHGACGGEELQQPLGRAADAGAAAGGPATSRCSRSA